MADSSEPAFLFLYRKGAVAPVDYLSTLQQPHLLQIKISEYPQDPAPPPLLSRLLKPRFLYSLQLPHTDLR